MSAAKILYLMGGLLGISLDGLANTSAQFDEWAQDFKTTAQHQGIHSQTVEMTVKEVRPLTPLELQTLQMDVIDVSVIRSQLGTRPTPKATFSKKKAKKQTLALRAIEKKYGVPYTILIAIWCIESNFGQNPTNFHDDTLFTLAYNENTPDLFESRLLKTLQLIDDSSDEPLLPTHKPAFPADTSSSFSTVVFDRETVRSVVDKAITQELFASIAKYLYNSGWKENEAWGYEVKVSPHFKKRLASLNIQKSPLQWERLGVTLPPRPRNELPSKTGSILHLNGRWFIVYPNFRVLLKWNSSINFALSVGLLSNQIRMESAQ